MLFVLAFALANIALYSIVNFHQNRIFGKELSKIDEFFIKKDEKQFNTTTLYSNLNKSKFDIDFPDALSNICLESCIKGLSLINPRIFNKINNELVLLLTPIRGPPILS